MDDAHFDHLTRLLATGRSRRQAVKALVGAAAGGCLALVGAGPVAGTPCRVVGKVCRRGDQCCPGAVCRAAPSGKRRLPYGVCGCPEGSTACFGGCIGPNEVCQPCQGAGGACTGSSDCCGDLFCRGEGGRSVCSCGENRTACGSRCVDTTRDRANCGACGTACPTTQSCREGRCCVDEGGACTGSGDCCSDARGLFCFSCSTTSTAGVCSTSVGGVACA